MGAPQNRKKLPQNTAARPGYGGTSAPHHGRSCRRPLRGHRSRPLHGVDFDRIIRNVHRRYRQCDGPPIPALTPHILRHSYCTGLVHRGLDVKSVQYLMGHASAGITLDIYSHVKYADVREKLLDLAS